MRVAGWILAVLGFALVIVGLNLPTYELGEVNNIGLLFDRLVFVVASSVVFLSGIILIAAGHIVRAVRGHEDPPAEQVSLPGYVVGPGLKGDPHQG